jgi:hypothetical protein
MNRQLSRSTKTRRNRQGIARTPMETLESRLLMAGTPTPTLTGDVLATLIQDVNRNGVADAGEPGLSGWTVFVDADGNGVKDAGERFAVTDSTGKALITGVEARTQDVREIVPAGFEPAAGFKDFDRVSVKDGRVNNVSFLNVSIPTTANSIEGTVWNDIDRDGIRGAGDPGIPGWTVFLDLNTDRFFEAGEPSAITDGNGFYAFQGLAPGRYKVREITPAGWDATTGLDGQNTVDVVAGRTAISDFGNYNVASLGSVRGSVWNDVNADGFRAAGDPGLSDWTVFLDLNGDGALGAGEPGALTDASGVYSFPTVTVGTYRVTEVLKDGWNVSPGHALSVNVNVVNEGTNVADFANFTPTLGSISGRVWNDADGNGFIGAGELGLSGWKVFIDQDGDGLPGASEPSATTDTAGDYTFTGVAVGSAVVKQLPAIGWSATAPGTGMQLVNVPNGTNVPNVNFGNKQRTDGAISGVAFNDANGNGTRDAGEHGLPGIPVYLDSNENGVQDAGEPSVVTSNDLFYTPAVDESGTYSFTHLPAGTFHVREVVPDVLSATPVSARARDVDLIPGEDRQNVNFADVYRANEIHGVVYDDANRNHVQDAGEAGIPGVTVYVDANRNDAYDADEPRTTTAGDGSYSFTTNLKPGSYVVRALHFSGREHTYPTTTSGVLWPAGVSNPAVGNVTPTSITTALAKDQSEHHSVSLTLPGTGALTNMVDVFLLFDDTGSFTANSPIVRAAFPEIIASLQAALPGVDLGFGVGRFEEYANFAAEFSTGRPFILNQPIISQSTPGFSASIQSALDRTAPGYGGDQPESDVEALYQMATGAGFDGNNNGTTTDSGAAGQVSTQLLPGNSGDVPSFGSFTVDPSGNVLPASGSIGGAGFRPGALPIILTATDTGFAFQPAGETSITGVNGVTVPVSAFTQTSRPTTPFNSGAGLQQTVTALNALGALVIGLGTNATANVDPRQGLESFATLTGAVNRSLMTIPNGTTDPIAPGDPLYFQISSGFGASVANGVVTAIENGVSNVDVNLTVRASDPNVHIEGTPQVINHVGAGETATFDVTFTGDGKPHRFDLQFVREGTNVVLGSIPVVMGTPIAGDGYDYVELEDGEIHHSDDFGDSYNPSLPVNVAPSFDKGGDQSVGEDSGPHSVSNWATNVSAGPASDAGQVVDFVVTSDTPTLFTVQPTIASDGTLSFTPAPGATGTATVTVAAQDTGGTVGGGANTSTPQTFTITVGSAAAALPSWVSPGAAATWDAASKVLNVTGEATITSDPAGATINADGPGASLRISPADALAVRMGGLHLTNGAVATFTSLGAARSASNHRVLMIGAGGMSVDAPSRLDLTDNDLAIDYTGSANPRAAIEALVSNGFNGGDWKGTHGITSSIAALPSSNGNYALGVADNALLVNPFGDGGTSGPMFSGQAVSRATVLVKLTNRVDLDLDGLVTGNDAAVFNGAFSEGDSGATWMSGDLDLDGIYTSNDAAIFNSFYDESLIGL